jgi:hypothetical protein
MSLPDSIDLRESEVRDHIRFWRGRLRSIIAERIAAWPSWTDQVAFRSTDGLPGTLADRWRLA